jgi:hypothetical protein
VLRVGSPSGQRGSDHRFDLSAACRHRYSRSPKWLKLLTFYRGASGSNPGGPTSNTAKCLSFVLGTLVACLSPRCRSRPWRFNERCICEPRVPSRQNDRRVSQVSLQETLGNTASDGVGREAVLGPLVERYMREARLAHRPYAPALLPPPGKSPATRHRVCRSSRGLDD